MLEFCILVTLETTWVTSPSTRRPEHLHGESVRPTVSALDATQYGVLTHSPFHMMKCIPISDSFSSAAQS